MNPKKIDNIDKLAKDAFEGFEVEFNPSDWIDFQHKLKAESLSQNVDHIDKLAKNAFEGFEVELNSSHWADFQQKLKAESAIDKIAKETLQDYEVPFDIRDWNRLEQLLDKKERIAPFIWWFKTAEVGIVALSLLAVFNICPKNNSNSSDSLQKQKYANNSTLNTASTTNNNLISLQESIADNSQIINNSSKKIDERSGTNAEQNSGSNNQKTSTQKTTIALNQAQLSRSTNKKSNTTGSKNKNTKTVDLGKNNDVNSNNNSIFNGSNDLKNSALGDNAKEENIAANTSENKFSNISNTDISNAIDNAALKEDFISKKHSINDILAIDFKNNRLKNTDPLFEIKRQKQILPFRCRIYLGAVATIGVNFAPSLGGTSIGYGLGFTMDTELSPIFALKTALIFSYKGFEENETLLLDKTLVDGNIYKIDKNLTTHLSVVEIPLDFQYIFFQDEKWKLYGTAGISLNMIAGRLYTGKQSTNYQGLSVSTNINTNDYESGLFEGGQFTQNVFLSVGAGLGVERKLGRTISLYILPTYRHAVMPIGADFMSSFNVSIGLKTVL